MSFVPRKTVSIPEKTVLMTEKTVPMTEFSAIKRYKVSIKSLNGSSLFPKVSQVILQRFYSVSVWSKTEAGRGWAFESSEPCLRPSWTTVERAF